MPGGVSGVNEDSVQFQVLALSIDRDNTDVRKLNLAVIQLQEQCTALRNRVIALEQKVLE